MKDFLARSTFESDEEDKSTSTMPKSIHLIIALIWYAFMFVAIMREKYGLLVFGCVIEVIGVAFDIGMLFLLIFAAPYRLTAILAIISVLVCVYSAVYMYSLFRLVMLIERN